jgi:hypothetical protein
MARTTQSESLSPQWVPQLLYPVCIMKKSTHQNTILDSKFAFQGGAHDAIGAHGKVGHASLGSCLAWALCQKRYPITLGR